MLNEWMLHGRFVWYITGNYDKDEAIKLVEQTREKFGKYGMQNAPIESLPKVQVVKLKPNFSALIEEPLVEENNNSCAVIYY